MKICHATEKDIEQIMKIYEFARHFMAEHGNPNQWEPTNWPPEKLIHSDIASGNSYVCTFKDELVATFFFSQGKDIEPICHFIENGGWMTVLMG